MVQRLRTIQWCMERCLLRITWKDRNKIIIWIRSQTKVFYVIERTEMSLSLLKKTRQYKEYKQPTEKSDDQKNTTSSLTERRNQKSDRWLFDIKSTRQEIVEILVDLHTTMDWKWLMIMVMVMVIRIKEEFIWWR